MFHRNSISHDLNEFECLTVSGRQVIGWDRERETEARALAEDRYCLTALPESPVDS